MLLELRLFSGEIYSPNSDLYWSNMSIQYRHGEGQTMSPLATIGLRITLSSFLSLVGEAAVYNLTTNYCQRCEKRPVVCRTADGVQILCTNSG